MLVHKEIPCHNIKDISLILLIIFSLPLCYELFYQGSGQNEKNQYFIFVIKSFIFSYVDLFILRSLFESSILKDMLGINMLIRLIGYHLANTHITEKRYIQSVVYVVLQVYIPWKAGNLNFNKKTFILIFLFLASKLSYDHARFGIFVRLIFFSLIVISQLFHGSESENIMRLHINKMLFPKFFLAIFVLLIHITDTGSKSSFVVIILCKLFLNYLSHLVVHNINETVPEKYSDCLLVGHHFAYVTLNYILFTEANKTSHETILYLIFDLILELFLIYCSFSFFPFPPHGAIFKTIKKLIIKAAYLLF